MKSEAVLTSHPCGTVLRLPCFETIAVSSSVITSLTISWHESPRSAVFFFLFFLFCVPSSALGAQDWSRFTVFRIQPVKV